MSNSTRKIVTLIFAAIALISIVAAWILFFINENKTPTLTAMLFASVFGLSAFFMSMKISS